MRSTGLIHRAACLAAACWLTLGCQIASAQPTVPTGTNTSPTGPGSQVLNAAGTVGNLVVVGPLTQGVQDASAYTGPAVAPKGLTITANLTQGGSTAANTSALYWSGTFGGTCSGASGCYANSLIASTDSLASTASNGSGTLQVQTMMNSASLTGGVTAFFSYLNMTSATGNSSNNFYSSATIFANSNANDGGTGGARRGSLISEYVQSKLLNGATFYGENSVQENDLGNVTGSSVGASYGMKVVLTGDNAVAAAVDSAAYAMSMQPGSAATLACGLCSGANGGASPLASTADFIAHHGAGTAPSIATGVNFSNFTFSGASFIGGTQTAGRTLSATSLGNSSATAVGPATNIATGMYFPTANQVALSGNGNAGLIVIGSGVVIAPVAISIGSTSGATSVAGELGFEKISASGVAPGGGFAKVEATAGTNAGSCKIIAYAGTSTTPVTLVDNVGSGC